MSVGFALLASPFMPPGRLRAVTVRRLCGRERRIAAGKRLKDVPMQAGWALFPSFPFPFPPPLLPPSLCLRYSFSALSQASFTAQHAPSAPPAPTHLSMAPTRNLASSPLPLARLGARFSRTLFYPVCPPPHKLSVVGAPSRAAAYRSRRACYIGLADLNLGSCFDESIKPACTRPPPPARPTSYPLQVSAGSRSSTRQW